MLLMWRTPSRVQDQENLCRGTWMVSARFGCVLACTISSIGSKLGASHLSCSTILPHMHMLDEQHDSSTACVSADTDVCMELATAIALLAWCSQLGQVVLVGAWCMLGICERVLPAAMASPLRCVCNATGGRQMASIMANITVLCTVCCCSCRTVAAHAAVAG